MSVAQHSSVSRRVPIKEAAEYIGVKPPTLKKHLSEGKGPPVIRIGRRMIFDTTDLDAYLVAHWHVAQEAVSSATEAAGKAPRGPRARDGAKKKVRVRPEVRSARRTAARGKNTAAQVKD